MTDVLKTGSDLSVASFFDPEWLGLVVGMQKLWTDDVGADFALRTCAIWTRSSTPGELRTRLTQVWVHLQDVRRHYHADRVEQTRRFRKVGAFRDAVAKFADAHHDQPIIVLSPEDVRDRFKRIGTVVRDMVVADVRSRLALPWYQAQHTDAERFLRIVGALK